MAVSLAHAHTLMRRASRAAPDRRRFRRIAIGLHGRLMSATGAEFDCRTIDVSPGDAQLACPSSPKLGDAIILYLQRLGRMEATVVRLLSDSLFAVTFGGTPHKREKNAEQLFLMLNPQFATVEERRALRNHGGGATVVELEDGGQIFGDIVDFSMSGMAIRTARPRPLIGAWVRVGGQHGRVSRYFEDGFAVDFEPRRFRLAD